jgi:hypothetical protein
MLDAAGGRAAAGAAASGATCWGRRVILSGTAGETSSHRDSPRYRAPGASGGCPQVIGRPR